jgi:hypothetical protein
MILDPENVLLEWLAELHVIVEQLALERGCLLAHDFEVRPVRMQTIHDHCLNLEISLHKSNQIPQ